MGASGARTAAEPITRQKSQTTGRNRIPHFDKAAAHVARWEVMSGLTDREQKFLDALSRLGYDTPEKADVLAEIIWRGYLRRGFGWGQTLAALERKGLVGSKVDVIYQGTDIPARRRWWITQEGKQALVAREASK